jgi:hypothetical protein
VEKTSEELREKTSKGFNEFKRNLVGAIDYYRGLAEVIGDDCRVRFLNDLDLMFAELETILPAVPAPVSPQAVIL